jgi:hypothetical protein
MAGQPDLERWWDGLSEQERADAIRSEEAGQLSDAMRASLETAGVIRQGEGSDRIIPGRVHDFLKMRH